MSAAPAPARFEAPTHWQSIEFISDLHLNPAQPRTFDAWARYLETTRADAVLLLGDVFEVWVGDDSRLDGFEQRCTAVLSAAAKQRYVAFMPGNRDFLVGDTLLAECGVRRLDDPTLLLAWNRPVLLTHGDSLCLDDVDYQRFRALVRSAAWQQDFLAKPLEERRQLARQMRDASEQAKRTLPPSNWADVDAPTAVVWLRAAGAHEMVHGHTHRPGSNALAPGFTRHVLSDWDVEATPPRAEVLRLTRAGFERLPFAA